MNEMDCVNQGRDLFDILMPVMSTAALFLMLGLFLYWRYRSRRDVYYTHVYQNTRESLDHILVSQEFYDNSLHEEGEMLRPVLASGLLVLIIGVAFLGLAKFSHGTER